MIILQTCATLNHKQVQIRVQQQYALQLSRPINKANTFVFSSLPKILSIRDDACGIAPTRIYNFLAAIEQTSVELKSPAARKMSESEILSPSKTHHSYS